MRSFAFAALVLALAACNRGDDGEQLAGGTSELSAAQIDAALGPADQSAAQDAAPADGEQNGASDKASEPLNSADGNQEVEEWDGRTTD